MKLDPQWLRAASARLPSSAKLIDALYRVIQQPDVDINKVIKLVSMDIAISTRLLRMANSVTYIRGEAVSSLDEAFTWLGVSQVYRVACITVSAQLYDQNLPVYRITSDRLLANSIATAVGMEILAKKNKIDSKTGYTIGLLHNLGRIVLQQVALQLETPAGAGDLPDIHSVMRWERKTFGCTYTEVGYSLLALWGMNPLFGNVIYSQHDGARSADPVIRQWSALLHLTATLVATTDYGLGVTSDAWPISESMFIAAGLPSMDILQISDEIAEATKVLCEQSGLAIAGTNTRSL